MLRTPCKVSKTYLLARKNDMSKLLSCSHWVLFCHSLDCAHGKLIRNGRCNDEVNNVGCIFDGGDCCGPCVNVEHCTVCECLGNITTNNGLFHASFGDHGISNALVGNGICNDEVNNFKCGLDGFDCCGGNVNYENCTECNCHGEKKFVTIC